MKSGRGFSGSARPAAGAGGFAAGAQSVAARQLRSDGTAGSTAASPATAMSWRRHHHHRGFFPGPVFGFGYNDYDDEPDVNQCWVLRRVYNARGLFVGWRHVDICAG